MGVLCGLRDDRSFRLANLKLHSSTQSMLPPGSALLRARRVIGHACMDVVHGHVPCVFAPHPQIRVYQPHSWL